MAVLDRTLSIFLRMFVVPLCIWTFTANSYNSQVHLIHLETIFCVLPVSVPKLAYEAGIQAS